MDQPDRRSQNWLGEVRRILSTEAEILRYFPPHPRPLSQRERGERK